jgi:uncharacterized protein
VSPSAHLARLLYRWRLPLSAFVVLGALFCARFASLDNLNNDLSAWVAKDSPEYRDYDRFRLEFGGGRTLIVAIAGDGLFSPAGLGYIERITRDIEREPLVERVQSLATANVVRQLPPTAGDDGGIEVSPLVGDRGATDTGAAEVKREATRDPLLRGDLVSADGRVTALVIATDEERIDAVRGEVIERIRRIIDTDRPAGLQAYFNGPLEISETYNRITIANQRDLTPPILLITLTALYVMFRSARKVGVLFFAIGVSVLWTLGLYVLLGYEMNVLTSMLTPLVVVLAVADDVHIVQHFGHEIRAHGDPQRAFESTIRHLATPLFGASVTTALGLLSLATSDVVAVHAFGVGAAVGVMVDMMVSIVLVPTMLTWLKRDAHPPPQEAWLLEPLRRLGRWSFGHARLVLAVAALVLVAAGGGLTRLRVDTNHVNFFAPGHPLHESADLMDRELAGIYSFNVMLEGPPDALAQRDALARMERLSDELRRQPMVRKVTSVVDYIKRTNQQLEGGSQTAHVLPASGEAIAQELFVFGLSDEGRLELERVVASDYSRAHITVKLASMSSDVVFEQIFEAERIARAEFEGSNVLPTVTGAGRIFATLDHYMVTSQVTSFATAFVTVFGVIFLVFRSAKYGVLAIVANVVPVAIVLGMMGWLDISLNVATIMVASVALGIVDDDTIHFIARYRREVAAGAAPDVAVERATMDEGRASLTTAIVNGLSFGILWFSEYKPTAWFGSLLAATMVVAFLAEVFIVPAVIATFHRVFGQPDRSTAAAA